MGSELQGIGRALLLIGALFAIIGTVLLVAPKIPWLGRLPGDIVIERPRFALYVPLASCLVASALVSFVLWLIGRFR